MQLPMEAIIYVVIFVGVLALVEGIYLVAFGKSISLNSRVNRRLDMLEKGVGREQVLEQLRKEMQQHMKSQSIPLVFPAGRQGAKGGDRLFSSPTDHDHGFGVRLCLCRAEHRYRHRHRAAGAISIAIGIGGVYAWVNHKPKTHGHDGRTTA